MARRLALVLVGFAVTVSSAHADILQLVHCQRKIARAGARFAYRTVNATLDCTTAVNECQTKCDLGVYGPSCDTDPPPCCNSDDPGSNQEFGDCMASANTLCVRKTDQIAAWELKKQEDIINRCSVLTQEELCGVDMAGLNFATLNAGCLALNPNYVCNVTNLAACVGGPLQRALIDQMSGLLSPRAGEGVAALGLQPAFPDVPITRKLKGQVAEGKADVWGLTGQAGDQIVVKVVTRDDNGNNTANLHPVIALLDGPAGSPVADTTIRQSACPIPNICGSTCPQFKRTLPFDGTFYLGIKAADNDACAGGKYRLIVVSPGGDVPTLVLDDTNPSF